MIRRARSAFREVLEAMEQPKSQLLQRDPAIKGLVENIVRRVEEARKPENWPVEEYPDEFAKYHPQDRYLWSWLLYHAAFVSDDLASILCILRGMGCELVEHPEYGYAIRPIIGGKGFESMERYNYVKEPLNALTGDLLPLLKQLRDEVRRGKVIPASEYRQGRLGER